MEVFRMKRLLATVLFAALLISCNLAPDNPLVGAARSGDTQAIAALLAGGADPNQRWGVNSWTPLMHAIHKDQKGSVEALLAGGQDNVYARAVEALERVLLPRVLRHTAGHQTQASELLGIARNTLRQKLRALGFAIDKTLVPDGGETDTD